MQQFCYLRQYLPLDSQAEPSRLTTAQNLHDRDLVFVSKTFDNLPTKKELKKVPKKVEIYQFDDSQRKKRAPFLLVHGLRGEQYPHFRWQKVANYLSANKSFNSKYKIYLARYATNARMEKTVPLFREAIDKLYDATANKPISVMALSIGGNLVYEALTDEECARKVNALISLGTPFHGSPLFSQDWMQYSIYKRLSWPWTRVDHSLSQRLYFSRNKNLLDDFGWDGYDQTMPSVGKFRSKLLFGPKGNLEPEKVTNTRLREINEKNPHLKKKIIAYGAYLENPYLESRTARVIESTLMYPVTVLWVKLPAYLAREHPVLKVLNRDIASVNVSKDFIENNKDLKSPFLYALNDGITPVASALFLPADPKIKNYLTDVESIHKIASIVDVRHARLFANIDHLTFIDDSKPIGIPDKIKDVLAPKEEAKNVFAWILDDILKLDTTIPHIAEEDGHKDSNKL